MRAWVSFGLICVIFFVLSTQSLFGQTVMLPTVGVFSIDTAVAVPDRGSTYLGGNSRSQSGQVSRLGGVPGLSYGASRSSNGVSAHVTIIDLDALDRAILASLTDRGSQAAGVPDSLSRASASSSPDQSAIAPNRALAEVEHALRRTAIPHRTPDYAYLAVISHPDDATIKKDLAGEVQFYLDKAQQARSMRKWASVQVMYEQLWANLPLDVKRDVIEALAESDQARQDSKNGVSVRNGLQGAKRP